MGPWTTTREPEKPKTSAGRRELLRVRALQQIAALEERVKALRLLSIDEDQQGTPLIARTVILDLALALPKDAGSDAAEKLRALAPANYWMVEP